jgi:Zn-dependent protease
VSDGLLYLLMLIPVIVLHELSHGYVAHLLGDDTAKNAGRLTLNPLKHVDPFGSILVPLLLAVGQIVTIGIMAYTTLAV